MKESSVLEDKQKQEDFKRNFKGITTSSDPFFRMIEFKDDEKHIGVWIQDIHMVEYSKANPDNLIIYTSLLQIVLQGRNLGRLVTEFCNNRISAVETSDYQDGQGNAEQTIVTAILIGKPEEE